MGRAFEAILFDLGNTLVYDQNAWEPILEKADAAMRRSLERSGYPLPAGSYGEFASIFDLYYHRRRDGNREETTVQLLSELLESQGASPPDEVLRAALQALYAVTQENWHVEPDAHPTLGLLREKGYPLGLVSNAADDRNVQDLIDKAGIREYFDFILSSAACGVRKPDPQIFRAALEHFGAQPGRAMMVGDTLEADILGANNLGMYSVWLSRRAPAPPEGLLQIQPNAVVSALKDLPGLLEEIEAEAS